MTLRSRLVLGLVILAACLVTPLALAIGSLERLSDEAQNLSTRQLAASLLIARVREGLNEGFKFHNPREKDRCGCGESFRV